MIGLGGLDFGRCLVFTLLAVNTACASLNDPPTPHKVDTNKKSTKSVTAASPANPPGENPWTSLRKQMKKQNWEGVIAVSNDLMKQAGLPAPRAVELQQDRLQAFSSMGDYTHALMAADDLQSNPTYGLNGKYDSLANDWVDNRLSHDDQLNLSSSLSIPAWKSRCLLRLGDRSFLDHDTSSARRYWTRAMNEAPGSESALKAQEFLTQLEAAKRVESKTIGVALPLTGKFANVGKKTLRGIEMGLGLYADNNSTFKLAVVDTEGNPDSARKGVDQLVREDNVIAIIGSVLSKTAPAVASRSSQLGVPSVTLSQKSGVTEMGPTVFRNAITSGMQIRKLVKTAMLDLGLKRFAILYPNDQYGVEYANLFWDEVLARGGSITAVQTYSPKETDFRYVVQRLVGTYYLEDRSDEYKVRLADWSKSQGKHGANRDTPPDDILPPNVDFDAVFIPDDAKALGQISAMLAYNNVKNVNLLGTNLWNVPGLHKRAGNFSKELLFVDGFVSSDPKFQSSNFVRDYKKLFNEEPGAFEIEGYDTALLLRQIVMSGQSSREGVAAALSQVQDFSGAIGKISMLPNRELLRPMVALTLDQNEVVPFIATPAVPTNKSQ